jgi:anti-sigma regulatory factor (Ser/Thr protein kinase)
VPASTRIPIEEGSRPAEARRIALRLAHEIGFDEVCAGQVAIVVTEACTNLLKHAQTGEILLGFADRGYDGAVPEIEMLSLDKGPGMHNLDQCLEDGYTTGSSPGQGLGAIRRLSGESDFYTVPGEGTAILARWPAARTSPGLRIGGVSVSKYGEEFCGDAWGIEMTDDGSTILLADGLGHGYEASQASLEAVRVLREHKDAPPGLLMTSRRE